MKKLTILALALLAACDYESPNAARNKASAEVYRQINQERARRTADYYARTTPEQRQQYRDCAAAQAAEPKYGPLDLGSNPPPCPLPMYPL